MTVTAFIARSFDPVDVERIQPILKFLGTFSKAGFICDEAEPAEVESVSVKVRRMIDEKDAFVGLFTRKYPVYALDSGLRDAVSLACGKLQPQKWSAPPWVLQESGYAIGGRKKLILLREKGVDIPGLQGDLEYVPFDSDNPSAVFSKLSEMINDLLAKAAGREVRTEVVDRPEQAEVKLEAPSPKQDQGSPSAEQGPPDVITHFIEMADAGKNRDLPGAYKAWQAGKALIAKGDADIDDLAWDCWYFRARYEAGEPDGLETLRKMRRENPGRHEPVIAIASLLAEAKEHDEAAKLFLEAARLGKDNEKAADLLAAARSLNELKRYEEGTAAVEEALSIETADARGDAIALLYELLKNSGEAYFAFARAEAALHDNPHLPLRFRLGLDYRRHGLNELALHHFKFLYKQNPSEASSLHNLALLYSDCELPITSVSHYKQSFKLGETLSAANLGFKLLDAGMAAEATDLIKEAMAIEPHDKRVEACLADISQRPQDESNKESELLQAASSDKGFLVLMGLALQAKPPAISGRWRFPFGEMTLVLEDKTLTGQAEITKPGALVALASLMSPGAPREPERKRVERYSLTGKLQGAVCKFALTVSDPELLDFALYGGGDARSGFMVFAADGKSGTYIEVKDDKLTERHDVRRVA